MTDTELRYVPHVRLFGYGECLWFAGNQREKAPHLRVGTAPRESAPYPQALTLAFSILE